MFRDTCTTFFDLKMSEINSTNGTMKSCQNSLFSHLFAVKDGLLKFLILTYENFHWSVFINKYANSSDISILKRIKAAVWIDKDINNDAIDGPICGELTNDHRSEIKYFMYYTQLLNAYMSQIKRHNNVVYVLTLNPTNELNIIDEFITEITYKIDILHRILNIYGIDYVDTSDVSSLSNVIIFSTGSISYSDIHLKNQSLEWIPDSFDNIYETDNDRILCRMKLAIKSVLMSSLPVEELVNKSYGLMHFN